MDSILKSVLICDTQPVAVEGVKWLIENSEDLGFAGSVANLELLQAVLDGSGPDSAQSALQVEAVIIDKGFGVMEVMELLRTLAANSQSPPAVVWGSTVTENEALRLLQAGAKGVLRRTSESNTLLTCLRAVTSGGTWMEDGIFGTPEKIYNPRRSELTSREREIVALVEKGLRNRDIAQMLGIQTGTVKIHLKHIFEKTGVRGRYGLAFTGLQGKGSIPATAPPQFTA
jgi:two-component system nitrate/nitrite response regulator NarL